MLKSAVMMKMFILATRALAAPSALKLPICAYSLAVHPPVCAGFVLQEGDEVISMSILKHVTATPEERTAYLKRASALRGADTEGDGV
jgi:hypothetical protein